MTNEEPLTKEKTKTFIETDSWDEGNKYPQGFLFSDVQTAVELLKSDLNIHYDNHNTKHLTDYQEGVLYGLETALNCVDFCFPVFKEKKK